MKGSERGCSCEVTAHMEYSLDPGENASQEMFCSRSQGKAVGIYSGLKGCIIRYVRTNEN